MTAELPAWKRALVAAGIAEFDASAVPPTSPTGPAKPTATPAQFTSPGVSIAPPQVIDQGLHTALMRAGLQRKTTFSGLIESAERLRNVPGMDDTQRIKAAAAMAGSVTTEMIAQAASAHIGDVALERSKFGREIATAKASRVDTVISQAAGFEGQAQTAHTEIQRLTAQIATLSEQANTLRTNAAAAEAEIAQTVATFEATAAQVEQYITSTRDAIVSALK
jgi:hypothetical protein